MEEDYGKLVYQVTKDDTVAYRKKRAILKKYLCIVVGGFSTLMGIGSILVGGYDYFEVMICFVMPVILLVGYMRDKKKQSQIDYDNFYACVYENGFVINNGECIQSSLDEIANIKGNDSISSKARMRVNSFNVNKNDIIIYKKSGDIVILDAKVFGDYMDMNVFYEELRRAFAKQEWEIKRAEYYSKH